MIGAVSVVWQRLQLAADRLILCLGSARRLAPHIFVRLRLKVGGKLPPVETDWKMLKGRHGDGSGEALSHVRASFLRRSLGKASLPSRESL